MLVTTSRTAVADGSSRPTNRPTRADTTWVLTLACPNRPGLVHAVSSFLVGHGSDITDSQQFDDRVDDLFCMRVEFASASCLDELTSSFAGVAAHWDMTWHLAGTHRSCRTLVMVSKAGHCLNDLLYRAGTGELDVEIPLVVSNHPDLGRMAAAYDLPFAHVPNTRDTKAAAEERLRGLVDDLDIDLVVLARYMQVLSDDLCRDLQGRIINIHHSFLPSFKGARPYHQAYDRGVKLVGATAHYVTPDLDEGPIIEQDVTRVTHRMTPDEMAQAGREVEARVLSGAVRLHAQNRLVQTGGRVVVFT